MRNLEVTLFLQIAKHREIGKSLPRDEYSGEDDDYYHPEYQVISTRVDLFDLAIKYYGSYGEITSQEMKNVLDLIDTEFNEIELSLKQYVEDAKKGQKVRNAEMLVYLQAKKAWMLDDDNYNIYGREKFLEAREESVSLFDLAIKYYGSPDTLTSIEVENVLNLISKEFNEIESRLKQDTKETEQREDPDYIPF